MKNIRDTIYELETGLTHQDIRTSAEKLTLLLADDFIEYGSSGLVYNKEVTIDSLTKGPFYKYTLYDFEIFPLTETIIQTRFKTCRTNPDNSNLTSLRSSIWKKTNDNWQMYFHQGTPVCDSSITTDPSL